MTRDQKKILVVLVVALTAAALVARRVVWYARPGTFRVRPPATEPLSRRIYPPSAEAAAGYQELDADLSALRERFNEDAAHIRIVLLVSPT